MHRKDGAGRASETGYGVYHGYRICIHGTGLRGKVTTTLQLLFAANWEEFNCTLEALKEAVPLHVVVEDVADKAGGRVLLKETAVSATVVFGLVIV